MCSSTTCVCYNTSGYIRFVITYILHHYYFNKSPLQLTDPRDAMPHAHRPIHRDVYGVRVTMEMIDVQVRNFISKVLDEVLEVSTFIFGDTRILFHHSVE